MTVPTSLGDLSTTASSNPPDGAESASLTDDYLRATLALLRGGLTPSTASITAGTTLAIPDNCLSAHIDGSTSNISAVSGGYHGRLILLTTNTLQKLIHGSTLYMMDRQQDAYFWPGDAVLLSIDKSSGTLGVVRAHMRGNGGTYRTAEGSYLTMFAGQSTVTITHNLGVTPKYADVTITLYIPSSTATDNDLYVYSRSTTQVTIGRPTSAGTVRFAVGIDVRMP